MTRPAPAADRAINNAGRGRRCLLAGVLALAMALSSAAHSYTLDELLSLPLERLLQLEISPRMTALAIGRDALTRGWWSVNGGRHGA
jgi:hypothetical protein